MSASGGVAAAVLIGTAAIAASQTAPSATTSSAWTSQPMPALSAEREVNQQDCTRPIDLSAGNLRCR